VFSPSLLKVTVSHSILFGIDFLSYLILLRAVTFYNLQALPQLERN
jgi:hypothetical protein